MMLKVMAWKQIDPTSKEGRILVELPIPSDMTEVCITLSDIQQIKEAKK